MYFLLADKNHLVTVLASWTTLISALAHRSAKTQLRLETWRNILVKEMNTAGGEHNTLTPGCDCGPRWPSRDSAARGDNRRAALISCQHRAAERGGNSAAALSQCGAWGTGLEMSSSQRIKAPFWVSELRCLRFRRRQISYIWVWLNTDLGLSP